MGRISTQEWAIFYKFYSASKPKNFILFSKPLPDVTTFQNLGLLKSWWLLKGKQALHVTTLFPVKEFILSNKLGPNFITLVQKL